MTQMTMQESFDHLQGQVIALRQLVLALAEANLDLQPDEFRSDGLRHIARARDYLLSQPVSESTLAGIEMTEQWLQRVTDA